MNQSKNYMIKTSNQNSRIYPIKQTDITNESAFPNTTYEELHFTMNKYNGNFNQNTADETNSQLLFNNTIIQNDRDITTQGNAQGIQ